MDTKALNGAHRALQAFDSVAFDREGRFIFPVFAILVNRHLDQDVDAHSRRVMRRLPAGSHPTGQDLSHGVDFDLALSQLAKVYDTRHGDYGALDMLLLDLQSRSASERSACLSPVCSTSTSGKVLIQLVSKHGQASLQK